MNRINTLLAAALAVTVASLHAQTPVENVKMKPSGELVNSASIFSNTTNVAHIVNGWAAAVAAQGAGVIVSTGSTITPRALVIADVDSLQSALDGKLAIGGYSGTTTVNSGTGTLTLQAATDQAVVPPDRRLVSTFVTAGTLAPNAWTTIFTSTQGPGVVSQFKYDVTVSGTDVRYTKLRITFDDAVVPQFGGTAGLFPEDIWGYGNKANARYRTNRMEISHNDGTLFCGSFKFPMPFQSSVKVEAFNPSVSVNASTWAVLEIRRNSPVRELPPGNWILHVASSSLTVAANATGTIFNSGTSVAVAILGMQQRYTGETTQFWMEGDGKFKYSGSSTAEYTWNGVEDFFGSDSYFQTGTYQLDEWGAFTVSQTNGYLSAYRFFPLDSMPINSQGIEFTWTNGDPGGIAPSTGTTVITTLFYYQK